MLARLVSLLLLLLTRDGVLHRLDGDQHSTEAAPRATSIAALDGGRVALLGDGRVTIVDGKRRRSFAAPGVRAIAGGRALWGVTDAGVVRIALPGGKQTLAAPLPKVHRLAVDGDDAFAERDGVVAEVGTTRSWKVAGHPVALAAGDGKLFVATREGPLWQIERAGGKQENLGLGDWWGTLALAYGDHALFAVTVSGKLWRIDPARRQKTIVAMDGWQGAIDLGVLR